MIILIRTAIVEMSSDGITEECGTAIIIGTCDGTYAQYRAIRHMVRLTLLVRFFCGKGKYRSLRAWTVHEEDDDDDDEDDEDAQTTSRPHDDV